MARGRRGADGGAGWTAAALALIASAAVAETPAAASPTLQAIVAQYVAWRGGAAFERLRAEHVVGVASVGGLSGRYEAWEGAGRWREETELSGIRLLSVTTRRGAWTTNASSQLEDAPDAYKYARRDPQSARALEGKDGANVSLLGAKVVDGRSWEVVRVRFGDADTYDDYIDPATGALGLVQVVEKGQTRTERYGDWRLVDGLRTPYLDDVQADGAADLQVRVTAYQANPRLDAALFRRPDPAPRSFFAGGAASTGWIAFAGDDPNRICLPVEVDGHPTVAMLDSGASPSEIDARLAAALERTPIGALPTTGENGRGADGGIVRGVSFTIGAFTLIGLNVGSSGLAAITRSSGEDWSVVLGDEVFVETVVDIDFAHRRIAFRRPEGFRPPRGAVAVRLARDGETRLVPISLEGGPPALFMMDTGFFPNLRISPALAKAQSLLEGRPQTTVALSAVGGTVPGALASLSSVRLGGVTFTSTPTMFSDVWPSSSFSSRVQGLLGLGLLKRFRVIVDWPHDRLWLVPNPGADAPFARDRLGLVSEAAGEARVVLAVYPGSPAAAAGLALGDRILTIDGRPAASVNDPGSWPAGAVLTLVSRRGKSSTPVTRTLTLRDYY